MQYQMHSIKQLNEFENFKKEHIQIGKWKR